MSLWIIYGMDNTNQTAVVSFASSLLIGIFPTVVFIIVAWLALRAGWSLLPTLGAGYLSWAILLAVLLIIRGGLT